MNRLLPSLLFAAACAAAAVSGRAELLLRAPTGLVAASSDIELTLVVTNPTTESVEHTPAPVLPVVLRAGPKAVSAVFRLEPPNGYAAVIPPGGFRSSVYRGTLPADLSGLMVVDATDVQAGRVAIEVVPPTAKLSPEQPPTKTVIAAETPFASESVPVSRRELGLSPHEPIYFSVGDGGGINARFQLSFKFRPIGPSDDRVAGRGPWEDVYLAFTQTSLWDLHSLSKPFTDSSYRPSLFHYRYDTGRRFLGAQLGYASGFEHESNGKAQPDSRSINILFARPVLRWGRADGWQVTFAPKLYAYLEKSENADIARYRGYGDYQFAVQHPLGWKLAATVRAGTSGRGSVLFDASYPFARINDLFPLGWVHGYLHLQFFNGWGESLLHYNERSETQFRIGFMPLR